MRDTKIVLVDNSYEADAITHAGTFHCDEVMATAILALGHHGKKFRVFRTNSLDNIKVPPCAIVYDIGGGRFDHHQKGGNGQRENGVPYSSCGLIWKEYGIGILQFLITNKTVKPATLDLLWENIDRSLIQGIDAVDCGTYPAVDYPCGQMSISSIIGMMNPPWNGNPEYANDYFKEAARTALKIFRSMLLSSMAKAEAYTYVMACIAATTDEIMVMERFAPWIDYFFQPTDGPMKETTDKIMYVVYPNPRGGWQWRVVPKAPGSFEQRWLVPEAWLGLRGFELQDTIGIPTANFVHPNGFTGGADTKDDCLKMVRRALAQGKKNE